MRVDSWSVLNASLLLPRQYGHKMVFNPHYQGLAPVSKNGSMLHPLLAARVETLNVMVRSAAVDKESHLTICRQQREIYKEERYFCGVYIVIVTREVYNSAP